ncbi:MAG: ABC transporter permease [Thermoprotei archaeon]|nr:MAG: ABC transporter permease [Thermoprotei archaeon]RLE99430.1 MAG: ABC transporter permease [Thermoprotei archaeon]HDI75043.1 ABC transporter permease [Thermoprotei archaeon]
MNDLELLAHESIAAGTVLLYATLGEILAERSGVLNLGLEGIMMLGAITAFALSITTGSVVLSILVAFAVGCLAGLLHSAVCVSMRGNQVVSGLALAMLCAGISSVLGRNYVGVPPRTILSAVKVPILSEIPCLGYILFQQNILVYLAYIVAPLLWFILFKTKIGVAIRACGDDPLSAESMGINVHLYRYLCTVLGGGFAGISGAYLTLSYTPFWVENITAGRGWISLALVILSTWSPLRAVLACYFFGFCEISQYWLQTLKLNPYLLGTIPYLATIAAISVVSVEKIRKLVGAPRALGKPYPED